MTSVRAEHRQLDWRLAITDSTLLAITIAEWCVTDSRPTADV